MQVEVQANRSRPKLAHHWFGERITIVKDLVRGQPLQQEVTLYRLGKGNSRVVYGWGQFVVKFTTVVFDHGDEEQLTRCLTTGLYSSMREASSRKQCPFRGLA